MTRSIYGLLAALTCFAPAHAQMPFGVPQQQAKPDPAALFRGQCGTCHATDPAATPRQGPNLAGIYQRQAGTVPGFKYSPGFAGQTFVWDDARLDKWLTNPQAMIPGAIMVYRQANADTRRAIAGWLKEQH